MVYTDNMIAAVLCDGLGAATTTVVSSMENCWVVTRPLDPVSPGETHPGPKHGEFRGDFTELGGTAFFCHC